MINDSLAENWLVVMIICFLCYICQNKSLVLLCMNIEYWKINKNAMQNIVVLLYIEELW